MPRRRYVLPDPFPDRCVICSGVLDVGRRDRNGRGLKTDRRLASRRELRMARHVLSTIGRQATGVLAGALIRPVQDGTVLGATQ